MITKLSAAVGWGLFRSGRGRKKLKMGVEGDGGGGEEEGGDRWVDSGERGRRGRKVWGRWQIGEHQFPYS